MTSGTGRPAATPGEHVRVAEGVRLHVERREGVTGAPAMVLVHGLASNLRLWDGVAAALHGRGHPVVALDQRGHGLSDAPEEGYDLDTAIADLVGLLDALRLDRPVLVGQSWGGNVVLELAWRWPERVRGVGCVDGGIIELADRFPTWEACREALSPPRLDHLTLEALADRLRAGHPGFPDLAIEGFLHCFRPRPDGTVEPRLARARHLRLLRALWEHRPSTRYATLRNPMLLLLADTGDPEQTAAKRRAEAALRGAARAVRVHWLAPAHHDVHAQFPEAVADLVAGAAADGWFA